MFLFLKECLLVKQNFEKNCSVTKNVYLSRYIFVLYCYTDERKYDCILVNNLVSNLQQEQRTVLEK